jgi:hypothetical protein
MTMTPPRFTAVGGFADQVICVGDGLGVLQNRLIVAAQIAGEDGHGGFALLGDGQLDDRGAEDVSGIVEANGKFGADTEGAFARNRLKPGERLFGFLDGVEGQRGLVAAVALLGGVAGILFLEVSGIAEENLAEIAGGGVGENRAAKTVAHQPGQVAGVVDVGVSEDHPVDARRVDGQRLPVALAQFAVALEEAAIHQQPLPVRFHQMFRAGDAAGGTEKCEFGHGVPYFRRKRAASDDFPYFPPRGVTIAAGEKSGKGQKRLRFPGWLRDNSR